MILIGATNSPWDLDPAVRTLFEKRVFIDLPDEEAREKLFKKMIGTTPHYLSDIDYKTITSNTTYFSAYNISYLVKELLMLPLKTLNQAKLFKKTKEGLLEPTYDTDSLGKPMKWQDIDP